MSPSPDELSLVSVGTIEITDVSRSVESSQSYIIMEEIEDNNPQNDNDPNNPNNPQCSSRRRF